MAATQIGLARSFYAWLCKLQITESLFPVDNLQTTIKKLKENSEKCYVRLKNTKHEQRALYWKNLFENYKEEKIVLNESFLSSVLDFLKKVFPANLKVFPGDSYLAQKADMVFSVLNTELDNIGVRRKKTWLYTKLQEWETKPDLGDKFAEEMVVGIFNDEQKAKSTLRYKFAMFIIATVCLMNPYYMIKKLVLYMPAEILEYLYAAFNWLFFKVYGKEWWEKKIIEKIKEVEETKEYGTNKTDTVN